MRASWHSKPPINRMGFSSRWKTRNERWFHSTRRNPKRAKNRVSPPVTWLATFVICRANIVCCVFYVKQITVWHPMWHQRPVEEKLESSLKRIPSAYGLSFLAVCLRSSYTFCNWTHFRIALLWSFSVWRTQVSTLPSSTTQKTRQVNQARFHR